MDALRRSCSHWAVCYGLAAALTLLATWLYHLQLAGAAGGRPPLFIWYYPAVIASAVAGGFGPGLAATALSAAFAVYFFVVPEGRFAIDSGADALGVAVFFAMGVAISLLSAWVERMHRRSEEALRRANDYNRGLLEASLDPLVTIDPEGRISDVNAATEAATGRPRSALVGTEFADYFTNPEAARSGCEHAFQSGEVRDYPLEIRHLDGRLTPVLYNAAVYRNEAGEVAGIFATAHDIGNIKHAESVIAELNATKAQMQELAYHDPLTHLPNRRLLEERLQQAITQSQHTRQTVTICYLDLDGFKLVNDRLGHAAGDLLLIQVASRLQSAVRQGDTVARTGGDEFVILLVNLPDATECEQTLQRILGVVSAPYCVNGSKELATVTASIGVTLFPQNSPDTDILLRQADQAMFSAKQAGRNRYQFFDIGYEKLLVSRHDSVNRIRKGFEAGEFRLYYQPQVDFHAKSVTGVEALLRWLHPAYGLLEAAGFLPTLEQDDLCLTVGDWVIQEALKQMQAWHGEGIGLKVSVNVFARQLRRSGFLEGLQGAMAGYPGILPRMLQIEITETAALPELSAAKKIIEDCHRAGIAFSIDDFGTGYCSLIYLRHLPAMELKIDKNFVSDMLGTPEDRAIVEGVVALGRAFGRSVIAEGVEGPGQMRCLLGLGCPLMQGYGIARPMPGDEVKAWVEGFDCDALLENKEEEK